MQHKPPSLQSVDLSVRRTVARDQTGSTTHNCDTPLPHTAETNETISMFDPLGRLSV